MKVVKMKHIIYIYYYKTKLHSISHTEPHRFEKKKSTAVIYSQKLKSDHLVSLMTFLCTNFVTF